MLTFGLLSPNKGIEFALRAMPDIIREFPSVVYIVLAFRLALAEKQALQNSLASFKETNGE